MLPTAPANRAPLRRSTHITKGSPHAGSLVRQRRRLLPRRRDLQGRQRRRHRRLRRPARVARPPRAPRRELSVAEPVLPVAEPRQRLRHQRLLRRGPAPRHARRLRRVHARGQRSGHARDLRSGREPHLDRPPVVPGLALVEGLALPRLVRVEGRGARGQERGDHLPRRAGRGVDAGRGDGLVVPAPLLRAPGRPERREPGGARGDPTHHGLLAAARRVRLPRGRGAVPDRIQGPHRHPGRSGGPLPAPRRHARLHGMAPRRGHPAGRGQRRVRQGAGVLRRRQPHATGVRLHRQPGDVAGLRARRRRAHRGRAAQAPDSER